MRQRPLPHPRSIPDPGFREFVALVAALMAINALGVDAMLPALPMIATSLAVANGNQIQWIVAAYILSFGLCQLVYGPLADRYGRKPVLTWSIALVIMGCIACASATSFEGMILARVIQGAAAAASRVLAVSLVRDRYVGRQMARVMSLTMVVFLATPILAPTIGQAVMLFASWRWIFAVLAIFCAAVLAWVVARLPETLKEEDRHPIEMGALQDAARLVITNRSSFGYSLAAALLISGMIGYVASAQQIFDRAFHETRLFTLIFACSAATMGAASYFNSRIVERFGMRLVSHSALIGFTGVAVLHLCFVVAGLETIWSFAIAQAALMACLALANSSFSAMAMEDMGHVAGTAASIQGFGTTVTGSLIGVVIGQNFNGTTLPISIAYALSGGTSLLVVLVVERGRLFQSHIAADAP